jgi:hypothetical protein
VSHLVNVTPMRDGLLPSLDSTTSRVRQQELIRGAALNSQADSAATQEYDAKALLLQSQMDYLQAHDELLDAMGSAPE